LCNSKPWPEPGRFATIGLHRGAVKLGKLRAASAPPGAVGCVRGGFAWYGGSYCPPGKDSVRRRTQIGSAASANKSSAANFNKQAAGNSGKHTAGRHHRPCLPDCFRLAPRTIHHLMRSRQQRKKIRWLFRFVCGTEPTRIVCLRKVNALGRADLCVGSTFESTMARGFTGPQVRRKQRSWSWNGTLSRGTGSSTGAT
jgi:hypothetical protein